MIAYDKGFTTDAIDQPNIIGELDSKIIQTIKNQLNENDCFINTTWIQLDTDLKQTIRLSLEQGKRLICYSGADWNNKFSHEEENNERILEFKRTWQFIEGSGCEVVHIGNSRGKHYFSFWLEFIAQHKKNFKTYNVWDFDTPLKTYMCLNRKPHRHRRELFNCLKNNNLLEYGYVSLGDVENPVLLDADIVNAPGDNAVSGNVGITNDIHSLGHNANWNNHFLNIVSETTTYTDVFITEKTFKPIIGERPFVILGDNNIYKQLKEWGFDTFDDVFGTGYENPNYKERMNWIVETVERFKNDTHLHLLLEDLKPRLQYNSNQLTTAIQINRKALQTCIK